VAVDIGGRVWLFGPTPEMIRMSVATLAVISLVAIIGRCSRCLGAGICGHLGGVGRRDRAGDDWQRRLQAHNETFTFLADIGFALIKSRRARPAHGRAGCLAGYWGSSGRTLAAWGPFGPDVTSNSTAWPSSSER
jgi:hypothetical protein